MLRRRRVLLQAWPLLMLPIVLGAAARGLWAPDEPRYAEVAHEAWRAGGDPWVLRLCGEIYPDKPPLLFWLAGAPASILGWHEFALRLPSLLATLGTAWLVGALARRLALEGLGTARTALLAPAIFLTLELVAEKGGRLQIDPLLTFFTTAAIFVLSSPGRPTRRRLGTAVAAVACAALTKGPVGPLIVLVAVTAIRLLPTADRRQLALPRLGVVATVTALGLVPVAVWATIAISREPSLAEPLLWGEHAQRLFVADSHPGPYGKQAVLLLLFSLPWTGAAIAGAIAAWRGEHGPRRVAPRLATAWILGLLLVFTLSAEKRAEYMQPAYPAVAILAASGLGTGRPASPLVVRLVLLPPAVLILLLGIGACASAVLVEFAPDLGDAGRALAWAGPLLGVPLTALGTALVADAVRGRRARWIRRLVLSVFVAWLGVTTVVFPAVDTFKSPRDLALRIAALDRAPGAIPALGVRPEGYRFYGDLPAVRAQSIAEVAEALDRNGTEFVALVEERELERFPSDLRLKIRTLFVTRVGSRAVHVLVAAD
jgi:4-amino-4-deoxy-L-arabinose transferase-like glycosyltransferase